ncbi:hypothetical protein H6P81_019996 [Aristolochia fimbriata]|uniref:Transposase MuDR plant domain-containing protein n=1 Tax=Aristolochia fimbriata TaxID=158543 RepID=A0AAV7DW85_ARIFI|nr:hypothetical protein H6P81_019996 [Aristolochia fimbriata]
MIVIPACCYFGGDFVFEYGNVVGYSEGTTRLIYLESTCSFNTLCTMMYNVLGGNPRTDHISIWLSFTCNGRLMYTPVLDDVSLERGLGQVKYGFQSMLALFVKRDTYSYEIDSIRSLENVGGSVEGAVVVYGGQAPAEGDDRVERPIAEFIPEERNTMVPKAMMMTMYPHPSGIGVGQRFMTKDALVMHLKDYCISRHVQFRVHKSGPTIYSVRCTGDQCPWHVYASYSMKLNMWKVRRCNDEHTCLNVELRMDNRLCTSSVICNLIMPNVRTSFTLSPYEIIQLVKDKYHIQVSYSRAWRAKNKTLVVVFGGWDESYNHLSFLRQSKTQTEVVRGRSPMCIISDRHSGIIRTVRDVFPRPHRHRFCIRHIIANLKKRYSVQNLNKMVWRCARAETVAQYDHEMQILEEVCPGAKAELTEDMSPEQWALAYDGNMSFGKLTTNSSERVNSLICFEIVELHVPDRVMLQFGLEQVTPPEDVEHVTRISRKGRARENWALYHRDYIARWEAREESVVMGSRAHTPRHAPSDYMRWYLGATQRFIAPPLTEPTMVYHPRGYTEEALPYTHHPQTHIGWRLDILSVGPAQSSTLGGSERPAEMCHMLGEPSHVVEPAPRESSTTTSRAKASAYSSTTTSCRGLGEVPATVSLRCSIFHRGDTLI